MEAFWLRRMYRGSGSAMTGLMSSKHDELAFSELAGIPQSHLKLHRNALIELVVFLAGAALCQAFLLEPGALNSIKPHPFWVPVILISLQYGTGDGLAAVAASAITQWLLGWPARDPGQEYLVYTAVTMYEPVLWLGSAIVIGELRERQIGETRTLAAALEDSRREGDVVARHLALTNERVRRLEVELAAVRPNQAQKLIDALAAIQVFDPGDSSFREAMASVVQILLDADAFSLFELRDSALTEIVRIGAEAGAGKSRYLAGDPLHDCIVRTRAVLSILRREDSIVLRDEAILAAPIWSDRSGTALGMLRIEHMPAARLDLAAERSLSSICVCLSWALDRRLSGNVADRCCE
jgi:hypothetical protein